MASNVRRIAFLGALILALVPGRALAACFSTAESLCLNDFRFAVEVAWAVPGLGSGTGKPVPLTDDTGLFWFFNNSNLELVVKVLDGRPVNGHFWVFYGGLSNVEYTITVTDTLTGAKEVYHNPRGRLASQADTSAFGADPLAAGHVVGFGALGEASEPAAAEPIPVPVPLRRGPELQVNVTTNGMQQDAAVAIGTDGGFLVVWMGDAAPSDTEVYGRLFDREGNPRGGEFRIHTTTAGFQTNPQVAASSSGEYMVIWNETDLGDSRLLARVFSADGTPLGEEIPIGLNPHRQGSPAIVADPAGGFLVAWAGAGDHIGSVPGTIFWQRFGPRGERVGAERSISRAGADPRLEASPTGGFLLTWFEGVASFETNVFVLRLDAAASPADGGPLLVNATGAGGRLSGYHDGAVPVFHADGGFSVIWTNFVVHGHSGTPGIFARRFGPTGTPAGAVVTLRREGSGSLPTVAPLPSGHTMVFWDAYGPADPDGGVFGQAFDGSWSPRGGSFRINTYTAEGQFEPAVAVDGAGNLVVAWSSGVEPLLILPPAGWGEGTQDGSFLGVFAQRFTTATCALAPGQLCLGGRFRVAVEFSSPSSGGPAAGRAVPLTSDTGAFWFFNESNVELIVKLLDGRAVNGRFWFFAGALSDVAYTITVTDTETGQQKIYKNRRGLLASRVDVEAFP